MPLVLGFSVIFCIAANSVQFAVCFRLETDYMRRACSTLVWNRSSILFCSSAISISLSGRYSVFLLI